MTSALDHQFKHRNWDSAPKPNQNLSNGGSDPTPVKGGACFHTGAPGVRGQGSGLVSVSPRTDAVRVQLYRMASSPNVVHTVIDVSSLLCWNTSSIPSVKNKQSITFVFGLQNQAADERNDPNGNAGSSPALEVTAEWDPAPFPGSWILRICLVTDRFAWRSHWRRAGMHRPLISTLVFGNSSHFSGAPGLPARRRRSKGSGPTCQHEQMVPRFPLLDHVVSPLVRALVHALHDVFDVLQLQPPQVLVLVQGVRQQLLHTVQTGRGGSEVGARNRVGLTRATWLVASFGTSLKYFRVSELRPAPEGP